MTCDIDRSYKPRNITLQYILTRFYDDKLENI